MRRPTLAEISTRDGTKWIGTGNASLARMARKLVRKGQRCVPAADPGEDAGTTSATGQRHGGGASGTNFDGLERQRRPHQEHIATPLGLNYLRCRW